MNGTYWLDKKRGIVAGGNVKKIMKLNAKDNRQQLKSFTISNFSWHKNKWTLLTDSLVTLPIAKIGCTTVFAQSFCYHENTKMNFDDIQYKHAFNVRPYFFSNARKYCIDKQMISKHQKKFIIFRDPKERIISAWKNRFNNYTFEEFLMDVDFTFNSCNINNIDQHINLQSNYYDFDDIDLFVELKDYPKFCEKNGIPWMALNQTIYTDDVEVSELAEHLIRKIYAKDYELIERIKSSEKLWTC